MKIGLLSDTHGSFDPVIKEYFKECDEVWHAGDIGNLNVLAELEAFKPTKAVWGNIDSHEIRIRTKEFHFIQKGKNKILMIHIAGSPGRYTSQVRNLLKEFKPTILICGHSHILRVFNDKKNELLYLNPGAAGKQGFHKIKTLLRFVITHDSITDLEVIELGPRAKVN